MKFQYSLIYTQWKSNIFCKFFYTKYIFIILKEICDEITQKVQYLIKTLKTIWGWGSDGLAFNPFLRGIKSNLFYAGGWGDICPPIISREKKFFAQFLLHTQTNTQNRVTHQKPGLYLVLKSPSVIWPEEFRQYFAFFTSSH